LSGGTVRNRFDCAQLPVQAYNGETNRRNQGSCSKAQCILKKIVRQGAELFKSFYAKHKPTGPRQINIVMDWFEKLKRRVRVK